MNPSSRQMICVRPASSANFESKRIEGSLFYGGGRGGLNSGSALMSPYSISFNGQDPARRVTEGGKIGA